MAAAVAQYREFKGLGVGFIDSASVASMSTTAGRPLFLSVNYDDGMTITALTDSKGNVLGAGANDWKLLGSIGSSGGSKWDVYAIWGGAGGAGHSVRVDFSGSAYPVAYFGEISGALTGATPFDVFVTDGSGGSPDTFGTGTLAQADNLLLSGCGGSGITFTVAPPFTIFDDELSQDYWTCAIAAGNVTSTANQNVVWIWTGPGEEAKWLLAIKSAGDAGLDITGAGDIASGQAFGSPALGLTVAPAGVASAGAMGSPALGLTIAPAGVSSGQAFGSPVVTGGGAAIVAAGIASAQAIGVPTVSAAAPPAPAPSSEFDIIGGPSPAPRPRAPVRVKEGPTPLQRVLAARYPRVRPKKDRAAARAKRIEQQGAAAALEGDLTPGLFAELMNAWADQRPAIPPALGMAPISMQDLFAAQIAFRLQQQQALDQLRAQVAAARAKDDEDAVLALLLA